MRRNFELGPHTQAAASEIYDFGGHWRSLISVLADSTMFGIGTLRSRTLSTFTSKIQRSSLLKNMWGDTSLSMLYKR